MDSETANILSLSKAQYLSKYPTPSGRPYDKLVVGAIIFRPSAADTPKLLMLKRAPHEKFYPNVFEIPGGHVEDDDASIFEAVKREVKEEAKLSVTRVVGQIESFSYASQKKVEKSAGEEVSERVSLQLNFVCMTDKETFCVDPEEHSEGMWASKEEVKVLNVTDAMKKVTECAF